MTCLEYELGFMHVYHNCHKVSFSLNDDILNANMTLFKMSLL